MTAGITNRQLFALACGVTIGYISIDISPLLLGAVSDGLGIGRARAGLLTSLEVLSFGLVMLLLAPLTPRLPERRTAILATIMLMVSHLFSALSSTFVALAIFRTLAGISEGILLAVVYAVTAGVPQSERVYARCISIMVIIAGALYFVVPTLTDMFSYRGAYGLVCAVALLLLPFLRAMPQRVQVESKLIANRSMPPVVVLLLLAIPMFTLSDGLVWPFAERIGVGIGLESGVIGAVLGMSFLIGSLGSIGADWLGTKRGYMVPILVGGWGTVLGGFLITHAGSLAAFAVGTLAKNVAIFFLIPYLLGAAATFDTRGRIAAAAGGLVPIGFGMGPVLGGLIADRWEFHVVGWTGLGLLTVASVVLIPVFRVLHGANRR